MEKDNQDKPFLQTVFDDFPFPLKEEWMKDVEATLKGAPYEKVLVSQTPEGIRIDPLYDAESAGTIEQAGSWPGFFPYVRGCDASGYRKSGWEVAQKIIMPTPELLNEALTAEIGRGLTTAVIQPDLAGLAGLDPDQSELCGQQGVSVACLRDIETAMKGVNPAALRFCAGEQGLPYFAMLLAYWKKQGTDLSTVKGTLGADPVGAWLKQGKTTKPLSTLMDELATVVTKTTADMPGFRPISIKAGLYNDAGASAVEELAFALTTGIHYLEELTQRGLTVDQAARAIEIEFAVGSNFFMETAKLRAARIIWANAVQTMGGSDEVQKLRIHVRTSQWNKTWFDPWVNILRATTETFSAIAGSADSIEVEPYDNCLRTADDNARRIARNTQIILREESQMAKVIDPAGGSYYTEYLTRELANRAWELFREIAGEGGVETSLTSGTVQKRVATTCKARMSAYLTRKDAILGTTQFPNPGETVLEQRDFSREITSRRMEFPGIRPAAKPMNGLDNMVQRCLEGATLSQLAVAGKSDVTAIQPLNLTRAAEPFELLRKRVMAAAKTPVVFFANMGPVGQYKARADFAEGFFRVAAFKTLSTAAYATVDEAAQAAVASDAEMAVICSTDDTYPELVPPFIAQVRKAKPGMIMILAGFPKDQVDMLKQAGIDEFIHIRADVLDTLSRLAEKAGVK